VSDVQVPTQISQRTVAKARTLLEALPFMREHHGKVIVVKYGGAAMEEAPLAASFAQDIALLLSAGIQPVVVHGGGPHVTKMSARLGIETTFVDGLRVTDAETLDVATMVLAGKLNTVVVASLVSGGVRAVGLSGVDGGLLLARKQTGPDLGFVGEVVHVDPDVVRTLMDRRFVPVVASIAVDEVGQAYNVNADVVAAELAIALGAEKLVFLNDVPGLIGPTGELLSELSADQCLDLLARGGVVEGGMIPKLESAADAIKAGVGRVHLVDGRVEHSLVLELFTPEGVGTMVTPEVGEAGA
jgi:acetylglutamate kinase